MPLIRLNIAYMRVAHKDQNVRLGVQKESTAITMQRGSIYRYLQEHPEFASGLIEIVDDGYTGSKFDGPGIKKVLQLVELDCVANIIVSDIARFSRNHIEAAHYLHEVFPVHNTRLITVDEDTDWNNYDWSQCRKHPHQAVLNEPWRG